MFTWYQICGQTLESPLIMLTKTAWVGNRLVLLTGTFVEAVRTYVCCIHKLDCYTCASQFFGQDYSGMMKICV